VLFVAINLVTVGVLVGIVAGVVTTLAVVLGPLRSRPKLRLHVHRDFGLGTASLVFTVHVFNDGGSTANNVRVVSLIGGEVRGENAGRVHVRPQDPVIDTRIPIPSPEFVVRQDDGTLDFPKGEPVFCACYRYFGWRWRACEPWPSSSGSQAEHAPRPLSVRLGGGFDGNAQRVTVHAVIDNDGGTIERGVVVDALIDGEPVASSPPVDVPSEGTQTADIDVPRRFVVSLQGQHPVYAGEFSLRATSRSGTMATFDG
jgi:hypothetical protein